MKASTTFHLQEVSGKIAENAEKSGPLWELQIDFLRIICSHEHFVPLNLPQYGPNGLVASGTASPTPSLRSLDSVASLISTMMGDRSAWAELSSEFRRQHFLVGLGLANLHQVRRLLEKKNFICWYYYLFCHQLFKIRIRIFFIKLCFF